MKQVTGFDRGAAFAAPLFFLARESATRNLLCVSIRDSGKLKTLVLLQQSGGDSPDATIL
jgi:hypothetical protein